MFKKKDFINQIIKLENIITANNKWRMFLSSIITIVSFIKKEVIYLEKNFAFLIKKTTTTTTFYV